MTINEAKMYHIQLEEALQNAASDANIDGAYVDWLLERYIEVIPEKNEHQMIFMKREMSSYKLGNIKIDLVNTITAILLLSNLGVRPSSSLDVIRLLLESILYVLVLTRYKIEGLDAFIVKHLHLQDTYKDGIEENALIGSIQLLYLEEAGIEKSVKQVQQSIEKLLEMRVIKIIGGRVHLQESVWANK